MLKGSDFIALVRITDRPGNVLAAPGQSCEKVPAVSLESLERRGRIKKVERPVFRRKPVEAVVVPVSVPEIPTPEPPPDVPGKEQ